MYAINPNFCTVYIACKHTTFQKFYKHEGFLFHGNQLCVLACSIRKLLMYESHSGLMAHIVCIRLWTYYWNIFISHTCLGCRKSLFTLHLITYEEEKIS